MWMDTPSMGGVGVGDSFLRTCDANKWDLVLKPRAKMKRLLSESSLSELQAFVTKKKKGDGANTQK